MNCLELSRDYFFTVAEPELKHQFPDLFPRLAAGLVGNGSECFGYDDELSRDHDWGVDFFIWTTESDTGSIPKLREWKNELFEDRPPAFSRDRSEYGANIGVMTCDDFYSSLIGTSKGPQGLKEWLQAPEESFAMAVNGKVFIDGAGEFTSTRNHILGYYPEDIRLKKIAAKCMALAQTGQYNHERTAKRRDWVTLRTILTRFTDSAISMAFLLNKAFKPYYKWAFRALSDLPVIGSETARLLLLIAETGGLDDESVSSQKQYISQLCEIFSDELRSQGLSDSNDWFLVSHGEEVRSRIVNSTLRSLPAQYEI